MMPPKMMRGAHELPHQSQITKRDLHGEQITRNLGGEALGWRLSAEQIEERRTGKHPGMPYEFIIHAPESCALAWTAFYTEDALRAFCLAYDITITEWPATYGTIKLRLPRSNTTWQKLTGGMTIADAVTEALGSIAGQLSDWLADPIEAKRLRSHVRGDAMTSLKIRNGWGAELTEQACLVEIERQLSEVQS